MSKMVMYINNYGLTELRLYTSWFMVLLAIVFVLIIIKQFRFDMKFSSYFAAVFTVMLGLLCFSRPEALIARYNIEMYRSGQLEELDKDAILRMSDDGLLAAFNEECYYLGIDAVFGSNILKVVLYCRFSVQLNISVVQDIAYLPAAVFNLKIDYKRIAYL